MARITPEYIEEQFYRIYAKRPHPERRGIIKALEATDAVMQEARPEVESPQIELPLEPDSEGGEA